MKNNLDKNRVVWYRSLAFNLVFWFLPLSVIPMIIISYDSYQKNAINLEETAHHDIEQAALLEKKFIQNWFSYRFTDIKNWSAREENMLFLEELVDELYSSEQSLHGYMQSDTYLDTTIALESDMLRLVADYDYLYDLFLIDKEGNILYSVEKESDLGTNILEGKLSSTKFSQVFKKTLKDQKIHFSDLEHYAPSQGNVAGFITAPLYDTDHNLLGVFAMQMKIEKIYTIFTEDQIFNRYFTHYLVGKDGLLRSQIYDEDEILKQNIETEQFKLWHSEHRDTKVHIEQEDESAFEYLDPYGEAVFGVHTDIDILGVEWVLISEAKLEPINRLKKEIINRTMIYMFIIMVIAFFIITGISTYITRPIMKLATISERFTAGARDIDFDINSNAKSEVSVLIRSFLEMIRRIEKNESELDEQKHALNAHSIVAVTDIKGNITFANDKFISISGFSKEELIGKNHSILDSGTHSKEFWKDMYKSIANGKVWHAEVKNITKNGEESWLDTTIVPFMDKNQKPKSYIAIRTDITDKKKDEAALLEAKALAEESVKAKSEFFASMSHEIRTPMNGVIGMLGLLLNTELKDSQRHQAYLAQSSANALLNLINDILDFSKVEAGKLELEKYDFNIRKEFGDFAEAIAFKAQEKGIEVILDMTDVDVSLLNGDMGRIRQILNNIVGNAIKFTSEGNVAIYVSLLKQSTTDAKIHIEVKDSGIGIPEEKIETLFDSFSQVDASTTRKYGGTGLGLAIVKQLCTLMNGDVKVESEMGKGSTFIIDIKVELSKNSAIVMPRVAVNEKKVLILDHNSSSANALKRQLEYWGMQLFIAEDEEMLDTLKAENLDLIYVNKDENSLSLVSKIKDKNIFENAKYVLITSLKESGTVTSFLEDGYVGHYPKPATTEDILASLDVLDPSHLDKKILSDMTKESPEKEESCFKDMKILLVDDNKVNQLVANGILEEIGLEADVAGNGLEALSALKEQQAEPYTIVLMDCQMPEMDGYEATEAIKNGDAGMLYKKIPVIAMTANAMEGDKEKCFASGMDDYLSKPIDPKKLEDMLRKYS